MNVRKLLATTVACIVLCGQATASAALVAFYTFEGNADDVSGNGRHGTTFGGAIAASGYEGQGYDFDGVDDFISIPVNLNYTVLPQLTMGGWVNPDAVNLMRTILTHDDGGFDRGLFITADGPGDGPRYSALSGVISGNVQSTGPDPAVPGDWVFLAVRYDEPNNTMTLDVNGDRVSVATDIGASFAATLIGRNPVFNHYYDGRMDNIFIFDQFLGDSQIDQIRTGGSAAILAVPEPSTLVLAALGLTLSSVVWLRRRRLVSTP